MGMNFNPMYQPVSTKTIKADGDLNINPYDLLATDVKCDTVEASEFVGDVGNFSSLVLPTSTSGTFSIGTVTMNTPSVSSGSGSTGTDIRNYTFNEAPHLTSTVPEVFSFDTDSINKTVSYNMFAVNVGVRYEFYQDGELLHSTTSRSGTFDLLYYDVPVNFTMQVTGQSGTISSSTATLSKSATTIYLP